MSTSRRAFLKGALFVTGTAALSTVPFTAAAASKQPNWDQTNDVVVGYGGAGAAAAIAAHDAGAKVAIFEKLSEGGGNTAISSGGYLCPSNYDQAKTYIEKLFTYSHSDIDTEQVDVFTKTSLNMTDYVSLLQEDLDQYIYGYAGFQFFEGHESIRKFRIGGEKRGGDNLFNAYRDAVENVRKIPVSLNSPAKELITNGDGEITGVIVNVNGKDLNVRANKGVILATGGFEDNLKMIQDYVKGYPIFALGSPGNTGDGILMAQKVSA